MKTFFTALFLGIMAFSPVFADEVVDVDVLRAKAANGDVEAASSLGRYYYEVKKNDKTAEKWLYAAAQAGNAGAQYYLALVYDAAKEGKHPNKEIVQYLEQSASQGYVDAQLMLGKIYQFGRRAIPKDIDLARKWYDMAAAKGSQEAMERLEMIYQMSGNAYAKAVQSDENIEWLYVGAKQGNAEAALNLAVLTEEGKRVPQDYKRAAELYKMAADAGIPQGQAGLGKLYANGEGVEQNFETAVFWLTKAAETGYVEAQRKLAAVYAHNLGDPSKAYAWQVISLSAMFPHAQDLVQVSPDLERLLRSMTPQQVKDGQSMAVKLVDKIKVYKKTQDEEQQNQLMQMRRYEAGM